VPTDLVIGVDVGGTKMLAGLVARDGGIGRMVEVRTPTADQAALLAALDALVEGLLAEGAEAIGVGVPMNLDRRTGVGLGAVNLPLRSLDLAGHLRDRFGVPVGVENDGNAIALAEWRVGAGRGATDLVALALGTGVGGGVVIDGRLYRGWAELGHVVVAADGPP
jgi:glucokinase